MKMQYLTSKTSLLTFVIILALLLFYLWFKYNIGLSSLMQQRAAWESRYDELLQDFEGYTAKVKFNCVFVCAGNHFILNYFVPDYAIPKPSDYDYNACQKSWNTSYDLCYR